MTPYRAAAPVAAPPPVWSTSLPRTKIGLYTGVVIALAIFTVPLPLALLVGVARTGQVFRQGGAGMYALFVLSLLVAVTLGTAGALIVRGKGAGSAIAVILPILPAVIGALLGVLGMSRVFSMLGGLDSDADLHVRILTAGLAETNALPAYGALIAAVACGVATCALLAGGASVDRTLHSAPMGKGWGVPAVIGALGFIVALGLRFVLHAGFSTMLVSLPSMLIVTVLACIAAANAPLVRHWREPRETDAWSSGLLVAALLAAGGFALLEIGASSAAEGYGLAAVAGEAIDPSQRARILAAIIEEQSAYRTVAIVEGLFGFLVVASAALAGLGRSSNGRLRFPRGGLLFVTLAGGLVVVTTLIATRAWTLGLIDKAGEVTDTLELPRVPVTDRLAAAPRSAIVLRVAADGTSVAHELGSSIAVDFAGTSSSGGTLIVDADRRARWADVAASIRNFRATRPNIVAIELRVTLLAKADRSTLAPYGALLGSETSVLHVALALPRSALALDDDLDADPRTTIRFRDFELMDAIAAAIAKHPLGIPSYGTHTHDLRAIFHQDDLAIFPPKEGW